jgi:hypothetical protein
MPFSDKKIEIHFRVNRKFGNSDVILSNSDGNVLKRFSREQMTPGEIEHINIPATLISEHAPSALILSASETFSQVKEADPS